MEPELVILCKMSSGGAGTLIKSQKLQTTIYPAYKICWGKVVQKVWE